ncbi:MAG: 50S ribosomal protein L32, partial [Alphaproteobacteria bacterium]|nr:50S ribosomal protein L32 [Alphaproteobacteria bacterium]
RSHHALKSPSVVENKHTGEMVRPHHICLKTGTYNGQQVIDID